MNRLLKVTGKRMLKDKILIIALLATLGISLAISLTNAPVMYGWMKAGDEVCLEQCFYNFAPLLGIIYASFVSLFVGVEYSDGTLRNKLIAGHSRTSVFLSLFAVSFAGCLLITAAWLIGSLPGIYWFGGFGFGWNGFAINLAVMICVALSFTAIFTTMAMLIPNKALSAVISLVLWFVMLFIGSIIVNVLAAPEMIYDVVQQGDVWVNGDLIPNPDYLGGAKRKVFEFISYIMPTCPTINLETYEFKKSILGIIGSIGVTLVSLVCGCIVFRKKDLK